MLVAMLSQSLFGTIMSHDCCHIPVPLGEARLAAGFSVDGRVASAGTDVGSVLMAARPLWSSRRTSRPTWPGP